MTATPAQSLCKSTSSSTCNAHSFASRAPRRIILDFPGLRNWQSASRLRMDIITKLCSTFPFSRRLTGAHTSCVNALAFSNGGRWLASGGDDLKIQLWDFHQDNLSRPSSSFVGPQANIFNLAFSSSNRFLFSGGADEVVRKYDLERQDVLASLEIRPDWSFRDHEGSIRAVSPHPFRDEIVLTGSEDGRIILFDDRESAPLMSRAQRTMQLEREVTGLQYHPQLDNLFLTCDYAGGVHLRDVRMAFGPAKGRTQQGIIMTYATKIADESRMANPEASSLCFNKSGSVFSVTFQHYLPTLYTPSETLPFATCSGTKLANGVTATPADGIYSNSCTMKHGAFGGPGLNEDIYYCAGSDDFRGYIWNIQSAPRTGLDERQFDDDGIAFVDELSDRRVVPFKIDSPYRLTGHQSIVNNIVVHPTLPYIATAGIESSIILHCPQSTCASTSDLPQTSTRVRNVGKDDPRSVRDRLVFFRALHDLPHGDVEDETEDARNISMFDHILRQEAGTDPFVARPWREESDDFQGEDSDEIEFSP
ncbi:WD40 repeat-like protein [Flagelloscypha sp. PMI_526]|nr:WD40 repeat-like protein [Flagelloscypha sp. PMI_526]